MKKNLLILLMFTFSGVLYAQTKTDSEKKSVKVEKVELKKSENARTVSNGSEINSEKKSEPVIIQNLEFKTGENQVEDKVVPTTEEKNVEEKISNLDSYINSIDQKIASVKSIPEKDKKARETGWYEQMEKSRSEAIAERDELIKSKK